jgi:DNA-binding CsgD family transcriptional regulator
VPIGEARRWFAQVLGRGTAPSLGRIKALAGAGRLAHIQEDSAAARPLLEESLALARQLGDRWWTAWALHTLGRVAYFDNDAATATSLGNESLAIAREVGDEWLEGWALHLLGLAFYIGNDFETSRRFCEECLAIRRRLGHREGLGLILSILSMVDLRQGDFASAKWHLIESLDALRGLNSGQIGNYFATLAILAATLGQSARAARIAGATSEINENVGIRPIPIVEAMYRPALDEARRTLGEDRFAAEQQIGRLMSLDDIIAEAVAIEIPSAPAPALTGSSETSRRALVSAPLPDGLSARAAEVLRLIAAGASTREIADQLVISTHTVERHITHVYQKIGARNRAEATAYAHQHGLARGDDG